MRESLRLTRKSLGAESMLHLDDIWRSHGLKMNRSQAAKLLQQHLSTEETYKGDDGDLADVLDLLESVAFFVKTDVLDEDIAWSTFYWPIVNYWYAAQGYIQKTQEVEGSTTWRELVTTVNRLRDREAAETKKTLAEIAPSKSDNEEFLRTEAALIP